MIKYYSELRRFWNTRATCSSAEKYLPKRRIFFLLQKQLARMQEVRLCAYKLKVRLDGVMSNSRRAK